MQTKKRKRIYFLIFWIVVITSFVFFATVLELYANGYKLNTQNFKLTKTGMIIVNGSENNVTLIIDGKEKKANLPYKIKHLVPGRHEIVVQKEGFQSWSKVFQVEAGRANISNHVTLYLTSIVPKEISREANTIAKINSNYANQNTGLSIQGTEMLYGGILITRFSSEILSGIRNASTGNFLVQVGDEIVALDADGSNSITLLKLNSTVPTNYYIDGANLIYINSDRIYQAQLH